MHRPQGDQCPCGVCHHTLWQAMAQWPDLVRYFSHKHDTFIDAGSPAKQTATIMQQAACRSFLACACWHEAKAAAALLQACQHRCTAQALLWQLSDAAQHAAAATHGTTCKQHSSFCDDYVLKQYDLHAAAAAQIQAAQCS